MNVLKPLNYLFLASHEIDKKHREFNFFTQEIGMLFLRYLGELKTAKIEGVKIRLTPLDSVERNVLIPLDERGTSITYIVKFDYEKFNNIHRASDKHKFVLDVLKNALLELAIKFDWGLDPIQLAYDGILKSNFLREKTISNAFLSPDGTFNGSLEMNIDSEFSRVNLFIIDLKKNVRTLVPLFKTGFNELWFLKQLDIEIVEWVDYNTIVVSNGTKDFNLIINCENFVKKLIFNEPIDVNIKEELKNIFIPL